MALEKIGVEAVVEGLSSFKRGLSQIGGGVKKTGDEAKKAGPKIDNMFKSFLTTGAVIGALGAVSKAVVDFSKESIAEFQTFEKQANEVFTLMPGLTEQATESMKADVLSFSAEVGRTTDETIPALYQAISAGVPRENVFEFLEVASDAALGGVTDLETAVDGITSVVNAYGDEVINAAQASDVMFTAVKLGKTDFKQLSSSLFNVIPTAASLGVAFEDVAANLAALTAQGTPTSVATTQLRAAFVEASKSGTKLDAALRELTGKGFSELIASGQTSSQIFLELRRSMPEQDFRDLFSSVEASNAVLGITSETAQSVIGDFGDLEDTIGATADAAETMSGSLEHLENRANAATEAFKIQAGASLSPLKKIYLESKIAVLDFASANHALKQALEDGTISASEYNKMQLRMTFTGETAVDVMERLSAVTVDELSPALVEVSKSASVADVLFAKYVVSANNAQIATQDLSRAYVQNTFDLEQSNDRLEYAARLSNDYTEAGVQLEFGLEELRAAEEQRKLATEAAAEADRIAAEELAALNQRTTESFLAATEAGNAQKFYNESLSELTTSGESATVSQDSVNEAVFNSIASMNMGAEATAIAAGALGIWDEAAVNAALKTALIEEKVRELTATWDGTAEGAQEIAAQVSEYASKLTVLDSANATTSTTSDNFKDSISGVDTATQETGASLALQVEKLTELDVANETTKGTNEALKGSLDEEENSSKNVISTMTSQVGKLGELDVANANTVLTNAELALSLEETANQTVENTETVEVYTETLEEVPEEILTNVEIDNFDKILENVKLLTEKFYTLREAAAAAAGAQKNATQSQSGESATGFQHGGFTGRGPTSGFAGMVHFNEVVIPENVLNQGVLDILGFVNANLPGGIPDFAPPSIIAPPVFAAPNTTNTSTVNNVDMTFGDTNINNDTDVQVLRDFILRTVRDNI